MFKLTKGRVDDSMENGDVGYIQIIVFGLCIVY